MFTEECGYSPVQKEIIVRADLNATKRGMCFDEANQSLGWPANIDGRAVANGIWDDWEKGLNLEERRSLYDHGKAKGEGERALVWAGAGVGLTEQIKGAGDVVQEIHQEAIQALSKVYTMLG